MTTFTGPSLLWDNGAYAPANPNLGYAGWAGAPWLNVGQTLPTSGGGGSPTMPPPQTPGGGGGSGSGSGSGSGGSGSGNAPNESVPPTNPEAVRQTADNIEADATREYKPGFAKLQFLGNDKVLLELPKEGKRPDGWDGGIGIPFTNREFVWKSWRWGDNGERTGMTLDIIPKDRGVSPKTEAAAIGTAKAAGVVGATALAAAVVVTVTPEALAASGIVIATGQVLVIIGVTDGAGRVVASIPVLMDADSTPAQIEEATFNLLTGGSEVVGGGLFAAKGGFKPGPLGYGNADYNLYGVPPGHEIVDLA